MMKKTKQLTSKSTSKLWRNWLPKQRREGEMGQTEERWEFDLRKSMTELEYRKKEIEKKKNDILMWSGNKKLFLSLSLSYRACPAIYGK